MISRNAGRSMLTGPADDLAEHKELARLGFGFYSGARFFHSLLTNGDGGQGTIAVCYNQIQNFAVNTPGLDT